MYCKSLNDTERAAIAGAALAHSRHPSDSIEPILLDRVDNNYRLLGMGGRKRGECVGKTEKRKKR